MRVVPESEMVDALLEEARKLAEEGAEARTAAADPSAAEAAAFDREQLLQIQGDANRTAARRAAAAKAASRGG